jgi:hypothetical protein
VYLPETFVLRQTRALLSLFGLGLLFPELAHGKNTVLLLFALPLADATFFIEKLDSIKPSRKKHVNDSIAILSRGCDVQEWVVSH